VKARSGPTAEGERQEGFGHRDESQAHPHAIESLRPGEQGVQRERSRQVDEGRDELGCHLEGLGALRRVHDHRAVDEAVGTLDLAEDAADEAVAALSLPR
jgi:hypothetical protein